jgi:hypothetical protein
MDHLSTGFLLRKHLKIVAGFCMLRLDAKNCPQSALGARPVFAFLQEGVTKKDARL